MSITPRPHTHVVVLGSSIAGMCAAAVFCKHADRVTLVDGDAKPDDDCAIAPSRKGTPQDQHLHVLLEGGLHAIEELIPGFKDHLVSSGAIPVTLGSELQWFIFDHYLRHCGDHGKSTMITRPLLERSMRQLVQRNKNVTWIWNNKAVAYKYDAGTIITGVSFANGSEMTATLVVDAMGRNSPGVCWLTKDGFVAPRKMEYGITVTYKTMLMELSHEIPYPFIAVLGKRPLSKNQGLLIKVNASQVPNSQPDREYVLVTLSFSHQSPAVKTLDEFLRVALSLPVSDLFEAIKDAKPMSPIRTYAYANPVWQRYDEVSVLPEGLLIVGDATCSLNPSLGQGMTLASQSVASLVPLASELVKGHMCRQAQSTVFSNAIVPFLLSAVLDHRYEETKGWTPPLMGVAQRLLDKLLQGIAHDQVLSRVFLDVVQLKKNPLVFFRPDLLLRFVLG